MLRVTPAEALKLLAGVDKRNKFNVGIGLNSQARQNRTYNGILYDSEAEARYAASLDLRVHVGELQQWWRQIEHRLLVNGVLIGKFTIDFKLLYRDNSVELVEVKGALTETYKLRVKLFRALYPDLKFTVINAKEIR